MIPFAQFKSELGVDKINFLKSSKTDREYATVLGKNIIISKNLNDKKPAYVFFNEEKNFYVVCNSTVVAGRTM